MSVEKRKFTLAEARKMNSLTQEEAAKAIGVSAESISNYERGKSYPDIPILKKMEEVYRVRYDQIIFLPLDYDKTVNLI